MAENRDFEHKLSEAKQVLPKFSSLVEAMEENWSRSQRLKRKWARTVEYMADEQDDGPIDSQMYVVIHSCSV